MGMDQYLLIPFLGEWTSIYQLFWCSPGVQGFDTLPYNCLTEANFGILQSLKLPTLRGWRAAGRSGWKSNLWRQLGPRWPHFHQWQLDPFQRGLVLRDTEKTSPVFCLKTTTRGSALIGTCETVVKILRINGHSGKLHAYFSIESRRSRSIWTFSQSVHLRISHRIHVWYTVYANIWGILMGSMLP